MAFGNLVLNDLDDLFDRVFYSIHDEGASAAIVDAIEQLHADYVEWFRDDVMREGPPPGTSPERRRG